MLKKAVYTSPGTSGARGFEDLECYQLALEVMVNAHEFARKLPSEEKYDLVSQVRRSSKSVSANIAEGYGRYHYLDSLKFYSIARGSLNETLAHFITARTLNYIDQEYFTALYNLTRRAEKALNGYMNYVRKQRIGQEFVDTNSLREDSIDYTTEDSAETIFLPQNELAE
ncbi:MAG: four helix bundle protein [Caldilineaceae bacterium]